VSIEILIEDKRLKAITRRFVLAKGTHQACLQSIITNKSLLNQKSDVVKK
jgi:hypothetical protein